MIRFQARADMALLQNYSWAKLATSSTQDSLDTQRPLLEQTVPALVSVRGGQGGQPLCVSL